MENYSNMQKTQDKVQVELKPKLTGFLVSYIIFSLPGFLASIVWLLIIIVLFFGAIGAVMRNDNQPETALEYDVITEGSGKDGILVYNLSGPITTGSKSLPDASRETGIYTEIVKRDFTEIKKNKNIKNVVFRLNTPGGEVIASQVLGDQIGNLVRHYNQEQTIFYFDSIVASGGLMATYKNKKNYVVASPYGETGSIGVYQALSNLKGTADKIGYKEIIVKSSESKDIGNPFRDPTSKEIQYLQSQVDREYKKFKDIVATGRNLSNEQVEKIANGLTYYNDEAKNLGLVDEVGELDSAISKAANNAGLGSNYPVWEIKTKTGFVDSILNSQAVSSFLKLPKATKVLTDRTEFTQPGKAYALDLNKF